MADKKGLCHVCWFKAGNCSQAQLDAHKRDLIDTGDGHTYYCSVCNSMQYFP